MKSTIMKLVLAGILLSLLPGTALADNNKKARKTCHKFVENEGYYGYNFKNVSVTRAMSGGYSVTGQIAKQGNRLEFNCVLNDDLLVQDLVINELPGSSGGRDYDGGGYSSGGYDDGAPAEATVACAEEGDRYWRVPNGTTVPLSSEFTGSGMYEVRLAAGNIRGVCTVTENGDVKSIMED